MILRLNLVIYPIFPFK